MLLLGAMALLASHGKELAAREAAHEPNKHMNGNQEARVAGYLHGDGKYNVLPVPAPLLGELAAATLTRELSGLVEPTVVVRAARLAQLHDLAKTADAFERVLRLGESTALEVRRSTAAIGALTWLGNEPQRSAARQRYLELLRRSDVEVIRDALLDAAYSLGTPEDADGLQRALSGAAASLKRKIAELKTPEQEAQIANLEIRLDRIEEYIGREVKGLERANRLREEILRQEDNARQLGNMVALYLEVHPQGTRRLADWAALRLVRASDRSKAAALFIEAAQAHDRTEPSRQKELDLVKARALRAAVFLGAPVETDIHVWLGTAPDDGTDLLALRPDWHYPPPHAH
ncbi:MAG TPA: hypothetical protein DCY13_19625 [Verrucomicrobiales bacterium]|nr:hypothetical protein [Verrucomicrobiales bacterium]